MSKFFKNNKLIVILCAIIVFIALIGVSLRSQSQSPVEQYVGDSVAFGQKAVSYPVQFVTGSINNLFSNDGSKEQSKKLKQLEAENERLESENKKYKKELDIEDISKFEPMTSEGLVGRISKVNQFSSQVDLISTNTRANRLSVNIQHDSKNVFGLIDHYDSKSEELVITDINNKDSIKKGDKVVTSGLADQLPSSIYIGEVSKVENDEYGLSKEVRVKTAANLSDLNHVYVAKRDPKTIPDDGSGDN